MVTDIETYRISASLEYIFMLGYGLALFSVSILITRRYKESSLINKTGYYIAILGVIAACCNGIEDIFILVMLMNPTVFLNVWAIAHSIFAFLKWILIYTWISWLISDDFSVSGVLSVWLPL